jgi:hypothetical protein
LLAIGVCRNFFKRGEASLKNMWKNSKIPTLKGPNMGGGKCLPSPQNAGVLGASNKEKFDLQVYNLFMCTLIEV